MAKISKLTIPSVDKDVEQLELWHLGGRNAKRHSYFGNDLLIKLKYTITRCSYPTPQHLI